MRLDHIGDAVLTAPFLAALKKKYPDCRTVMITNPKSAAVLESLAIVDQFVLLDAGWYGGKRPFLRKVSDFFRLARLCRSTRAVVIYDPRGDVRVLLAAALGRPGALRIGYGSTGGGPLLDKTAEDERGVHAARRALRLLGPVEGAHIGPCLAVAADPLSPIESRALLPEKNGFWIALHAAAGSTAKQWPDAHWEKLLEELAAKLPGAVFFWIADESFRPRADSLIARLSRAVAARTVNLCGRVRLESLGSFLRRCDLLISTDSAPAHIGTANGVGTIVLFSGTNDPAEWTPAGERARILRHPVPCAFCERRVCSEGAPSPCMAGIEPGAVAQAALERLGASA